MRFSQGIWSILAWGLWGIAQIMVVMSGVYRWEWSARMVQPAEGLTLSIMIVVQFGLSSLLGSLLLENLSRTGMAIAISVPMTMLATILSGQDSVHAIGPAVMLSVWLVCLWGVSVYIRRGIVIYIQMLAVLAGVAAPMGAYLSSEFGSSHTRIWIWISPTVGALTSQNTRSTCWQSLMLPIVLTVSVQILARQSRSKPVQTPIVIA